jgi:hypothetical protein
MLSFNIRWRNLADRNWWHKELYSRLQGRHAVANALCKVGTGCNGRKFKSKRVKVTPENKDILGLESSPGVCGGIVAIPPGQSPSASFVESVCLFKLRESQNEDGGWGIPSGLAKPRGTDMLDAAGPS